MVRSKSVRKEEGAADAINGSEPWLSIARVGPGAESLSAFLAPQKPQLGPTWPKQTSFTGAMGHCPPPHCTWWQQQRTAANSSWTRSRMQVARMWPSNRQNVWEGRPNAFPTPRLTIQRPRNAVQRETDPFQFSPYLTLESLTAINPSW